MYYFHKEKNIGQVLWYRPVIQAFERQGQEDPGKFKVSLVYTALGLSQKQQQQQIKLPTEK